MTLTSAWERARCCSSRRAPPRTANACYRSAPEPLSRGYPCCPWSCSSAAAPCWVAPHDNFLLFCRIVLCWRKTLEVQVLPLRHPSAGERADPKRYASNVADEMGRVMGVRALRGWNNIDALEFNKKLYNFVG